MGFEAEIPGPPTASSHLSVDTSSLCETAMKFMLGYLAAVSRRLMTFASATTLTVCVRTCHSFSPCLGSVLRTGTSAVS